MSLTHGSITAMLRGAEGINPTVQVINLKPVGPDGDRYRIILSDGDFYCQGMLATQQNNLVRDGQLKDNTLVQIKDYMKNSVQNRQVIIVLNLQPIAQHHCRIGEPQDIDKVGLIPSSATTTTMPASTTASVQPMYNRTNLPSTTTTANNPYGKTSSAAAVVGGGTYGVKNESSSHNPYSYSTTNNNNTMVRTPTAPIIRSMAPGGVPLTPISQLNMYQNRWTIKGRIVSKSDIRSWSNARGEGTLFSMEVLDASGTDVKCTFFKEAVDKFYGMLEHDKVYTFSGGKLKVANLQYNTCKCQYEITFDQNAEIHLVDDDGEIQAQLFDFVKIGQLEHTEAGKTVDIIGIVKTVGDTVSLVSKKTGTDLLKCDLQVVDDSGVEISLTLWGEKAQTAPSDYTNQPIVAFRRVRVSDYGGKSVSMTAGGAVMVAPPIPETIQLQQWWSSSAGAAGSQTRSLSSSGGAAGGRVDALEDRKTIRSIKTEHLGHAEKPDWISFKGTLTFIKKDKEGGAWYPACANADEPCKNRFKVTQTTDNHWFCDKCQNTFPNCVRRWIFSATVADDTSTTWVSFFNEQAETLLQGMTADQVYKETYDDSEGGGNQDKYDSYFARANHTEWIFKCKVKQEMMGDEARVKASVYTLHPINYAQECRDLLTAIAKF